MPRFPANADELSTELLTEVLQDLQPGISITAFENVQTAQCGDGLASTADRLILKLQYSNNESYAVPEQVMLKTMLLSPHAPHEMYENEVRFYREIRPQLQLETPRVFASHFDRDSGQFGIIMEDLNTRGAEFPTACSDVSVTQVEGLLRTLAKLHGYFWQSTRLQTELNWIATETKGGMSDIFNTIGFDLIKDQVEKHAFKQALIAPIGLSLEQMWEQLSAFQQESAQYAQTLLHGDTHVANTYLLPDADGGLFDWQLMIRGNWAHDVSYIIVTALSTEQRRQHERALLEYYLDCLQQNLGDHSAPDIEEAWYLYRKSIMWGLVIGWLITPPANYGEEITSANISKLVNAVQDLESFDS